MTKKFKPRVKRIFLGLLYVFIAALMTIPIGLAWNNSTQTKANTTAIEGNTTSIKDLVTAQGQVIEDLKKDNAEQTTKLTEQGKLIECLLAAHGQSQIISQSVQDACKRQSVKPTSTTNAPQKSTSTSTQSKSSSTKSDGKNTGNGGGNDTPDKPPLTIKTPLGPIQACVPLTNVCILQP